jgi:hypothetical protein
VPPYILDPVADLEHERASANLPPWYFTAVILVLFGRCTDLRSHPRRPDFSRAMSFPVHGDLRLTRSTVTEENIMTATYTADVFSTVDGFAAPQPGTWGGY